MHALKLIQCLRPIEAAIQILNRTQENALLRYILFQIGQEKSRGLFGRTMTATIAENTVRHPSRMNRYDQLKSLPLEM